MRPSKAKRASCKKKANNVDFASMANDPQNVEEEFFGQGEYMKTVVESRLRSFGEEWQRRVLAQVRIKSCLCDLSTAACNTMVLHPA